MENVTVFFKFHVLIGANVVPSHKLFKVTINGDASHTLKIETVPMAMKKIFAFSYHKLYYLSSCRLANPGACLFFNELHHKQGSCQNSISPNREG